MLPWLGAADPGRVHTEGRMARVALEEARAQVADLFGTRPRQVIFTSGATEAINAAVYGALAASPGGAAALADVEHSAVREASLRSAGSVVELAVDGTGRISVSSVRDALASVDAGALGLVHCQWANHEVGILQPVAEIVALCREHGVMVHVDAAAAAGHVPIAFDELGADLLSVSAHKLGGPRGIGVLLVRRGLRVAPMILGGAQERARRGGLENVAAAVGFGAVAAELSAGHAGGDGDGNNVLAAEAAAAAGWTARLRDAAGQIEGVTCYGPPSAAARIPNLVCMGVAAVEAEAVLIGLDQAGVAAHSGSSCSSEMLEPSPVLAAMGVDAERSLRLSVGWSTTNADVDRAVRALPQVIARLRALSAG
jgi:cysteine desulfurase